MRREEACSAGLGEACRASNNLAGYLSNEEKILFLTDGRDLELRSRGQRIAGGGAA